MRAYWINMGPNPMIGVLRRRKCGQGDRQAMLTHTEAKPCENGRRGRSYVFIAK